MSEQTLAIEGGTPAKQRPDLPMFPGGAILGAEEEAAVLEVLRGKRLYRYSGLTDAPSKVSELEKAFAANKGTRHAIAMTSGTAALHCALHGVGLGPGDEVIVPAYTWIATAASVLATGAVPVLAEVDETLLLDPDDLARKITPHTKAVIPVHMRGAPCRMDEIMAVAQQHNLTVIEDTAQANGGSYKGKRLGAIGDVGCFSLQFSKIMTSGEGGVVVTNDDDIHRRVLMFHDVNAPGHEGLPIDETICGLNYRMPEMLAAVALVQLDKVDPLLEAMRTRKRILKAGIEDVVARKGLQFRALADPEGDAAVSLVFFLDSLAQAKQVSQALHAENIGAWHLYNPEQTDYHVYAHWEPLIEKRTWSPGLNPWQWAHREINYSVETCPRSLDLLGRAVHLNVHPQMTNEDIEETIEGVTRVLDHLA